MKTIRLLRLLFAILLPAVVWLVLSSQALADGIYPPTIIGDDISYPQCGTSNYPHNAFGVVGVTGGKAFIHNLCLSKEFAWARTLSNPASLYMNLNAPIGSTAHRGMIGPYGNCAKKGNLCQAENYGYNAAQDAFDYATSQGASSSMWWLDIETANSWASNPSLNQGTINGAVRFFINRRGISVGIYSMPSMWNSITGNYTNNLPVWIPATSMSPVAYCSSSHGFTGGTIYLVQRASNGFDADYAC